MLVSFILCITLFQLKLLSVAGTEYEFPDDETSGKWKPVEREGTCGKRITPEFALGGKSAKIGEFPYMALIVVDNNGKENYACGGALINRRYVLTAAHCHTEKTPIIKVVLGELILANEKDCDGNYCSPAPQTIEVDEVIVHASWNPSNLTNGNDIALVRLATLAELSYDDLEVQQQVLPVCLPWEPTDPGHKINKEIGLLTGWGKVTNDLETSSQSLSTYDVFSRSLQQVDLPIVPDDVCKSEPSFKGIDTKNIVCAGGKGKESCQGDSGGPLVVRENNGSTNRWYLFGIVSFGKKECGVGENSFGAYTRVTAYLDWIAENLEE